MSGDDDRFEAELAAWSAGARASEAAEERLRRHHFTQQERESATIGGILVDLAERGATVELHLRQGSTTGMVTSVGPDVVDVRSARGTSLVPRAAIVAVSSDEIGAGDRPVADGRSLAVRLAGLVEEGSLVTVRFDDGQWEGSITAVGADVLVLDVRGRTAAVALAAVLELVLRDR